jgi:hypothetical protein
MRYNPENQYRCTIIRGKAQSELDDLLLAYASIISEITPSHRDAYNDLFNDKLSLHFYKVPYLNLSEDSRKTIRNHITEIAEKLFALSYLDENNQVHASESCEKILADNDQPAFFKNLCYNFQQPNGTQKIQTVEEKIKFKINSRPLHIVLALLKLANENSVIIYKTDIAYYILNSLDVLQGWVSGLDIFNKIIEDRNKFVVYEFDWSSSRDSQHVREQLNLLVLANLIKVDGQIVRLNLYELALISKFTDELLKPISINASNYDLTDTSDRKRYYLDWNKHNGCINIDNPSLLTTSVSSLHFWRETMTDSEGKAKTSESSPSTSSKEIGDEGELIVLDFEKRRVTAYNPRLGNKVIHVGETKGLGYDILSVEADELLSDPEFARFIEVKTTKRATTPDFNNSCWYDSINLTKREWIVARQHGPAFNIYRVYITPFGNNIIKISNPHLKSLDTIVSVEAITYRMDFEKKAIDIKYK